MSLLVCQLSGGFDSAAAAILEMRKGSTIHTVFYDYGQPYGTEEAFACKYLLRFFSESCPRHASHRTFKLHLPLKATRQAGEVEAYVPMRNLVLTAHSAAYAESIGAAGVVVGSKTLLYRSGDEYCFRDCSIPFYSLLEATINEGRSEETSPIAIRHPLIGDCGPMSKWRVLKILVDSGVDLDKLWNCYNPGRGPCGECYHCKELQKAKAALDNNDARITEPGEA